MNSMTALTRLSVASTLMAVKCFACSHDNDKKEIS